MSKFGSLWIEKYRPTKLCDLILSDENKTFFSNIKDEIPHLLFVSPPGQGKTTAARILIEDILQCQYLYINASDENGIDTIRNKVVGFSQIRSLDGKLKVVVLDEADGLTIDSQKCLRNIMEEYAAYTRFILTANYKHKICTPLLSRVQCIDMTPPIQDILKRVIHILVSEKIVVAPEQKANLSKLIKDCYPDIRKTISSIQKYCITGELKIFQSLNLDQLCLDIQNFLDTKKVLDLRKYLIENDTLFQGDYSNILKSYLNHIYHGSKTPEYKSAAAILIAEHLYKDVFVIDKEINTFACFCQLNNITP